MVGVGGGGGGGERASKKLVELVVGPWPCFLIFSWGPSIFVPQKILTLLIF